MTTEPDRRTSALTRAEGYFEDFAVGQRLRHARGATVGEVENNLVTKQVMNTADGHWNDEVMRGSVMGDGRLVYGLVTGSLVIGLASQDTSEQALAELSCTGLRFTTPVHLGDTLTAYTEVRSVEPSRTRVDAGEVTFHHWGVNQRGQVVFEADRTALIKRRSEWREGTEDN